MTSSNTEQKSYLAGNNTLVLNEATIMAIIQAWANKCLMGETIKVTGVKKTPDGQFNIALESK